MSEKEYIEREKTIRDLEKLCVDEKMIGNDNSTYIDFADAIEVVAEQPTADVQEVRHGKWETIIDAYGHIEGWLHKECGRQVTSKDEYCPHCGAKMDKESE